MWGVVLCVRRTGAGGRTPRPEAVTRWQRAGPAPLVGPSSGRPASGPGSRHTPRTPKSPTAKWGVASGTDGETGSRPSRSPSGPRVGTSDTEPAPTGHEWAASVAPPRSMRPYGPRRQETEASLRPRHPECSGPGAPRDVRHCRPPKPCSARLAGARSTEHGARSTEHGARSTEHGARSTEHGARSTEHGARSTEHGARSTEHGARSTEHGARSTERRMPGVSGWRGVSRAVRHRKRGVVVERATGPAKRHNDDRSIVALNGWGRRGEVD